MAAQAVDDKQSLCVDILVAGHVQAYVDFFYLTHRPGQSKAAADDTHPTVPPAQLTTVKTLLAEAEVARRRGDTKAVYASYQQLADLFGGLSDQRTAVYFLEKCAEIARLTSDAAGENAATRALGMAHEALQEMAAAIKYYEKLLHLAQAAADDEGERRASEHLVVAFRSMAASTEAAGELQQALAFREKCLEASAATGDKAIEGKAHFELGQVHEKLDTPEHLRKAVDHYEPYLAACEEADDTEGQGAACFALAHVSQRLQVPAPARPPPSSPRSHTTHAASLGRRTVTSRSSTCSDSLRWRSRLASSRRRRARATRRSPALRPPRAVAPGAPCTRPTIIIVSQAEACCSLGVLYNQQGDDASAVEYLERFFELSRTIGDRAMLDKVRRARRPGSPWAHTARTHPPPCRRALTWASRAAILCFPITCGAVRWTRTLCLEAIASSLLTLPRLAHAAS